MSSLRAFRTRTGTWTNPITDVGAGCKDFLEYRYFPRRFSGYARSAGVAALRAWPGLHGQLVADRQATDAFARRREDRIAERGRDRRYARLAHTPHWLGVVVAGDDVD